MRIEFHNLSDSSVFGVREHLVLSVLYTTGQLYKLPSLLILTYGSEPDSCAQ